MEDNGEGDLDFSGIKKITAKVPTLRPRMDCVLYSSQQQILSLKEFVFISFTSTDGESVPRRCLEYIWPFANILLERPTHHTVVGYMGTKKEPCGGTSVYIWNSYQEETPPPGELKSVFLLICNESVETVDVTASFTYPEFLVDTINGPPVIHENTARMTPLSPYITEGYTIEQSRNTGFEFVTLSRAGPHSSYVTDSFFSYLTQPHYGISTSAFGDPSQATLVVDTICFQQKLIRAQSLHSSYRTSPDAEGALRLEDYYDFYGQTGKHNVEVKNTSVNDTGHFWIEGTAHSSSTRLFLDVTYARILQVLLGITSGLSLLYVASSSRAQFMATRSRRNQHGDISSSPGMPMKSPTSLSEQIRLLAHSNIFEYLSLESFEQPELAPRDLEHGHVLGGNRQGEESERSTSSSAHNTRVLKRLFEGCRFKLGWVDVPTTGTDDGDQDLLNAETGTRETCNQENEDVGVRTAAYEDEESSSGDSLSTTRSRDGQEDGDGCGIPQPRRVFTLIVTRENN
ncbi:hypothetical protein V8F06_010456 [Rhypophila decipiens]